MVYELLYPSGHRQIWTGIETEIPDASFYYCQTFSPDGDRLEFRILSGKQLERTMKRVQRLGGEVRELSESS